MSQRPERDFRNWVSDDSTGISVPTDTKQDNGWTVEKPPYQFFNWMWNRLQRWTHYSSGQSQEFIIIDSVNTREADYATLAAYIADTPAAGDKVLVKEDQTLTAQMVIPSDITIKPLDGARLLCATNIATSVLQLGSNVIIEGVLNIVLSHTGTTGKAVELNGDNATGKINVENSSTGTLTTGYHINANKTGNQVTGFIDNTGGGVLTNVYVDNSGEDSNRLEIIDAINNQTRRSRGAYKFRDGLEFDLGADADGDIYYRDQGIVKRLPKKDSGGLTVSAGLPVWGKSVGDLVISNWYSRSASEANNWRDLAWAPELGLFAAVSESGTNRVMTSPDSINWTARAAAADNSWLAVAWSPDLTLFAAVAASGVGNRVMTSPDGINWTSRTSAADNDWRDIVWSSDLTLFVAVAITGTGNRVMTSPDGINWTSRTSAADNDWAGVAWSPELTLFAAVASSGTGNRVMTSPDGINWTSRTSAADNNWLDVEWSSELGLFVAVATSGTGNRVMTSPDGINWTIRTSAEDNSWTKLVWSPELGFFAAVALTGTGNRVMTSPDGINWTIRTSAEDNSWISVEWSSDKGVFAAVSFNGTNRVMTSLFS